MLLDKIRLVRNKYEHKMHDVRWRHSSNGSLTFLEMGFEITHNEESKYIEISLGECIPLLVQLNNLFDRIIEDIRNYARDNEKTDYEIYVINVGGYIGESTRSEIEYARNTGKAISYLEPVQEGHEDD